MSSKGKNSGAGKGKKASKPESNGDEVLQAVVSGRYRDSARRGRIDAMRRDEEFATD